MPPASSNRKGSCGREISTGGSGVVLYEKTIPDPLRRTGGVMTKRARAATSGPTASRPWFPREYGVSTDGKGLLPWSHVVDRMTRAQHYWICTTGPDGAPHATPVDGLWLDDRLYFGGSPRTRRQRNLATNPSVCVHLESAADVVLLHGDARPARPASRLAKLLAEH